MRRITDPLLGGPIILSPAQQEAFRRICEHHREQVARRLREHIEQHVASLIAAAATNDVIDADLARLLGETLVATIERWDSLEPGGREWLQVAVDYFVRNEDACHDDDCLGGLADDANVVAAVLEHCGQAESARSIRDYLA